MYLLTYLLTLSTVQCPKVFRETQRPLCQCFADHNVLYSGAGSLLQYRERTHNVDCGIIQATISSPDQTSHHIRTISVISVHAMTKHRHADGHVYVGLCVRDRTQNHRVINLFKSNSVLHSRRRTRGPLKLLV